MANFTVIATTSDRISQLVIKSGQLIFLQDVGKIAFDFKDKRVFYNQIIELDTEYDRVSLESPSKGYYFIIENAVLWSYQDDWVQITTPPDDIVFIGTELPSLGKERTLYVDKDDKQISVWDEATNEYIVVADKTEEVEVSIDTVTTDDINALF